MNKLIIGLLIIAAGTGTFLLLREKNKNENVRLNKELIIGKWQIQAGSPVIDTTYPLYQYDFLENGLLLRSLNDSLPSDTLLYEWNKPDQLTWKLTKIDTMPREYSVLLLTNDSMKVKGVDSINLFFKRVL